jgi:uncharacterized protein (TIGR02147 family)
MKDAKYDFVMQIKKQFEVRTSKNSNYSLRAFARDLDMLPSRLSDILNYKKGLSEFSANKIAAKLGLNENETELFILSAKSLHARGDKDKTTAKTLLQKKLSSLKAIQKLNLDDFELSNNWYHLTILELLELKDCDHSLDWFAARLNLNKSVVKSALERLQKFGWIKYENKKYKASYELSETSYDVSSDSIKKFHEELLKKAEHSLYFDDVEEREFLNMTMAFSQKQMAEAKKYIRQFQKDFAEKFYSEVKSKDSVYQLSIQLFRLDSKEN